MSDKDDKEYETARMMYINIMSPIIKICMRQMTDDEKTDMMSLVNKSFQAGWKANHITSNHDDMVKDSFDKSIAVIEKMMRG